MTMAPIPWILTCLLSLLALILWVRSAAEDQRYIAWQMVEEAEQDADLQLETYAIDKILDKSKETPYTSSREYERQYYSSAERQNNPRATHPQVRSLSLNSRSKREIMTEDDDISSSGKSAERGRSSLSNLTPVGGEDLNLKQGSGDEDILRQNETNPTNGTSSNNNTMISKNLIGVTNDDLNSSRIVSNTSNYQLSSYTVLLQNRNGYRNENYFSETTRTLNKEKQDLISKINNPFSMAESVQTMTLPVESPQAHSSILKSLPEKSVPPQNAERYRDAKSSIAVTQSTKQSPDTTDSDIYQLSDISSHFENGSVAQVTRTKSKTFKYETTVKSNTNEREIENEGKTQSNYQLLKSTVTAIVPVGSFRDLDVKMNQEDSFSSVGPKTTYHDSQRTYMHQPKLSVTYPTHSQTLENKRETDRISLDSKITMFTSPDEVNTSPERSNTDIASKVLYYTELDSDSQHEESNFTSTANESNISFSTWKSNTALSSKQSTVQSNLTTSRSSRSPASLATSLTSMSKRSSNSNSFQPERSLNPKKETTPGWESTQLDFNFTRGFSKTETVKFQETTITKRAAGSTNGNTQSNTETVEGRQHSTVHDETESKTFSGFGSATLTSSTERSTAETTEASVANFKESCYSIPCADYLVCNNWNRCGCQHGLWYSHSGRECKDKSYWRLVFNITFVSNSTADGLHIDWQTKEMADIDAFWIYYEIFRKQRTLQKINYAPNTFNATIWGLKLNKSYKVIMKLHLDQGPMVEFPYQVVHLDRMAEIQHIKTIAGKRNNAYIMIDFIFNISRGCRDSIKVKYVEIGKNNWKEEYLERINSKCSKTPKTIRKGAWLMLKQGFTYETKFIVERGKKETELEQMLTCPGKPRNLQIVRHGINSIDVSWDPPSEGGVEQYQLVVESPSGQIDISKNFSSTSSEKILKLDSLTAGQEYKLEVKSLYGTCWSQVNSLAHVKILSEAPDKPGQLRYIQRQDHLTLSWYKPTNEYVQFYKIKTNCSLSGQFINETSRVSIDLDVEKGECCSFEVWGVNEVGDGKKSFVQKTSELPGNVHSLSNITHVLDEENLTVKWQNPNPQAPGSIFQYDVVLWSKLESHHRLRQMETRSLFCAGKECIYRCNFMVPENAHFFQAGQNETYAYFKVSPNRQYRIGVTPKTIKISMQAVYQSFHTVPTSRVKNVRIHAVDENSVDVIWFRPTYISVEIKYFNVSLQYELENCSDSSIRLVPEIEYRSVMPYQSKPFNRGPPYPIYKLDKLHSYMNYTIQVTVVDSAGQGKLWSDATTFQTMRNTVTGPVRNIIPLAESRSVQLEWERPCPDNGPIDVDYIITVYDENRNMLGRHSTSAMTYTILDLTPATNYIISINSTSQVNVESQEINARTRDGIPGPVGNLTLTQEMDVRKPRFIHCNWTKPRLTNGKIKGYKVIITSPISKPTVQFPTATYLSWPASPDTNYTVQVAAFTEAGIGNYSTEYIMVMAGIPGPVGNLTVTQEKDVHAPRIIHCKWTMPRLTNGKIRGYKVIISSPNNKYTVRDHDTTSISRRASPDTNYTIQVAAFTEAGTGNYSTVYIMVMAGILPKPQENSSSPLVHQAGMCNGIDATKSLILNLPTKFMCDESYGKIRARGLIVIRMSDDANGNVDPKVVIKPVSQIVFDSPSHVASIKFVPRDRYHIVNIPDAMVPCYRDFMTRSESCGARNKEMFPFVIGETACSVNGCNRYLSSGSSYKFKAFICTSAACTHTLKSLPMETKAVSEDKSGWVGGVVVAMIILVIIIIGGMVAYKKKQRIIEIFRGRNVDGLDVPLSTRQPPTRPIPLASFITQVENMHKDSNLLFSEEYKLLTQHSPEMPAEIADNPACRKKNRYTNVLPFDHARVKLLPSDEDEPSDYINASFIPGYRGPREYIAAQGPLACTVDDFWRMIWEQRVSAVVMLTQCVEKGKEKCEQYWPSDPSYPAYYGDLHVSLRSESVLADYVIRVFDLEMGSSKKTVHHFHFLKWPDFGCPEKTYLLLNLVAAVRDHTPHNPYSPTIVHCSAGVGRTGTYIAIDVLLRQLHDPRYQEVDILSLVLKMRQNRPLMVQRENQYIYIFDCLRDAILDDSEDENSVNNEEESTYANC